MKKEIVPARFRLDKDAFSVLKDMFDTARDDLARIYYQGRMQNIQRTWPQFISKEDIPQIEGPGHED